MSSAEGSRAVGVIGAPEPPVAQAVSDPRASELSVCGHFRIGNLIGLSELLGGKSFQTVRGFRLSGLAICERFQAAGPLRLPERLVGRKSSHIVREDFQAVRAFRQGKLTRRQRS